VKYVSMIVVFVEMLNFVLNLHLWTYGSI